MKSISKNDLKLFLREMASEYSVIAPIKYENGSVSYGTFKDDEEIDLLQKTASPKFTLFPHTQQILKLKQNQIFLADNSQKRFVFGIRSCDMSAINYMDTFMRRDGFEDPHYVNRRNKTIFCVVECNNLLSPSCFCTLIGVKPYMESGFDLKAVELSETFVFECSEKYQDLLQSKFFREVIQNEKEELNNLRTQIKQNFQETLNLKELSEKVILAQENREIYEEMALRCIECGSCIYVCPSCTCFNVYDLMEKGEPTRYRTWDACLHEGFQREASGHNPRPTRGSRLKRRVEHKLLYDPKRFSMYGCVGCGRCQDSCPVNLGMLDIISHMLSQ